MNKTTRNIVLTAAATLGLLCGAGNAAAGDFGRGHDFRHHHARHGHGHGYRHGYGHHRGCRHERIEVHVDAGYRYRPREQVIYREVRHVAPPIYAAPARRYARPVQRVPAYRSAGVYGSGPNFGNAVGGAVGGFVGSQIGKGSGKLAATAAGAVMGYIIGGELGNPYR